MPISELLSLAGGVGGGSIKKNEVESTIEEYKKYRSSSSSEGYDEEKKSNYGDVVNKFYNLTASFYELCVGETLHFSHRWKEETIRESHKRHEHFLALQLGLKPGMKVLDVGCGTGGPLREIARFSLTSITGLNNNDFQIKRGIELNRLVGLDESCNYVKADFMKMPFPDNSFDAVFAIESTCMAADWLRCFKEIYRVLKPGQCFAAYEWCLTDSFDPNNETHQKIKKEIIFGTCVPEIRPKSELLETLKLAGFEVIWGNDRAADSPVPFYGAIDKGMFSMSSFFVTSAGRLLVKSVVRSLEFMRLAPTGSYKVACLLENGADAITEGGRKEIFSPMYFVLVRKPQQDS